MKSIKFLLLLIMFFIISSNSILFAETPKVEEQPFVFSDIFQYEKPLRKGDDEKKWFMNLSGGYTKKSGNTDSANSTYGCSIKYDNKQTVFKLNYSGSYGKLKGIVNENTGTATGNFDYFLFWRIEFFSYTMSDYNRITLLKHRNGTGAGAKIFFIRNNFLLIDLSGAPILQYEKYEEQTPEKNWRWSVRGRIEIFPTNDDFSIRYFTFYIPAITNNSNYRTIHDIYFYKRIAGSLGIKTGYRREYNTYDKKSFEENPLLKRSDSTTYIQISLTL